MFAVLGLALSWHQLPVWPGLVWALIFGFFVSLAPILLIVYLLHTKRISDIHMSNIRERRIPYIAGVLSSFVAFVLISFLGGPPLLNCLALFSMVDLILLGIVTNYWLISIHAASVAGTTLIAMSVFGFNVGLGLLPLAVVVSAVRLYLRRHSVTQVLAGLVLGSVVTLGFMWSGCFKP